MNQSNTSTSNKLSNNKIHNSNDTKGKNTKFINNIKQQASAGYTGTNIVGVILLIIVLIVISYSSYWLYNYYTKKSFIKVVDVDAMPDVKTASSSFNIASNLIPNSTYSNEYSISCWVNILDYNYNYGKEKVILRRGDKESANPEIILAPKTNDLIVRIKLQKPASSSISDTFIDIPISTSTSIPNTLNLDNYEETVSGSKNMYNTTENTITENFNISSNPAPIKFENNSNNSLHIDSDLGENKIDYPTIKYISKHNNNFDEQYFSMISGNNIVNNKSVNCNDIGKYTRGGNHSINESFDNVEESQKIVYDFLNDITNIMDLLIPITLTETERYVLTSSVSNMLIDFLYQINAVVKTGTTNFDTIVLNFKTTMNKLSTEPQLSNYIDTLVNNTIGLVTYNKMTYDYDSLTTKINTLSIITTYNIKPINSNIFNPTNTLLDNLIILIKQIQANSLQGSINGNSPKELIPSTTAASCVNEKDDNNDPTVGTCSIKMIPLQKWVNVIVSVYNQVVDIYIDGLLTSSCVLKTFPAISTSDVSLTPDGGFSGYISRVKFLNSAMTVQKAKNIYYEGPIYTETLFSQIPNWVYWTILAIILIVIAYSFFV